MTEVSFDFQAMLDGAPNGNGFANNEFDELIIDFEGSTVYNSDNDDDNSGTFSQMVGAGSTLLIRIRETEGEDEVGDSSVEIFNFVAGVECQPCPGMAVDVDIDILPALFADFDDANSDGRVCEGDNATICILGTPDATVSVFLGDGVFVDVKLDATTGEGCFTTVGGLLTDSDFVITGLTTFEDMPQCSFTFEAGDRPEFEVLVTPTPTATVDIDPATVCAGDIATADITSNTPNATVTYQINGGSDQTIVLDGDGEASIPLDTDNTTLSNSTVVVTLSNISVTIDEVTCSNVIEDDATLTIRPLPLGEIEAGDPACFGGSVPIVFTATTDVADTYDLEINGTTYSGVASGDVVFMATTDGDYTLTSITDNIGGEPECTNSDDDLSTTTVIIEDEPNLTADITGTAGTADLDNSDIYTSFRALVCDGATINVAFGTSTPDAQGVGGGGNLKVQVEVTNNEEGQVNVPIGPITSVIDFDDLNTGNFLDGILSNLADTKTENITVVLTPFFENGDDATLEAADCAGVPLSFIINIIPEVMIDFDPANVVVVCEGDDLNIELIGTPGAEVMFSSSNIDLDDDFLGGSVTLDEDDGTATITGTAGDAGEATLTIDMVMVTTELGNQSRQCMLMDGPSLTIEIDENPTATLSVDPLGPICNGETVDVNVTLTSLDGDGDLSADGSYTFVLDGNTITVDVVDGTATLIDDLSLTETTTFELNSVTNDLTGCSTEYDDEEVTVTIEVEDIPDGFVTVTTDNGSFDVPGGTDGAVSICANETVDLDATLTSGPVLTPGAESYVSVDFDISQAGMDFFGLGQSGTIALPVADFAAQFSRQYNMIAGTPTTVTLVVTYYNELAPGDDATIDDEECVGTTSTIVITINPNPKTVDVSTMTCSGEALDYDLDQAITNGVVGATFSYTVDSDDVDVSGLDRTTPTEDNITDLFTNVSDDDYIITYTVTPFGTDGDVDCQGNDFDLVVTVKPEPVITAEQEFTVCSGENLVGLIEQDNDIDSDEGETRFEIIDFTVSLEDASFVNNSGLGVGDQGDDTLLEGLNFNNTSSGAQTVTIVLRPTADNGCIGEDETIVVTVLPEAVVADFMIKVCSGGSIDLGFDDLTANGVGDILSFTRSTLPLTTIRVFDELGNDVTIPTFQGNSQSNPGITRIQDSYLNQGTATLSVFYDVQISVTDGDVVCDPETFTLEVKVVEEVDVVLEPINGQTAICAGEPITLVATYDGSGEVQSYEYSFTSNSGVVLELTPSAAGGEVVVDAVSGMGTATVMVMVTDDNSCVAMATRTVSVGTTPEQMDITGFEDPCIGDFSFYGITPTAGSTYAWSLSNPAAGTFTNNPATGPNVSITFNDSQGFGPFQVMVTETSASGCTATSSLTVNLFTETVADFSAIESDDRSASPTTSRSWPVAAFRRTSGTSATELPVTSRTPRTPST